MTLALFDLDNTLLDGDSDYEWGQYLASVGIVDREQYSRENRRFYEHYKAGTLDMQAFLRFSLRPLATNDMADLLRWREAFMEERIRPMMLPKAHALIVEHRDQGHTPVIITATNEFVTEPIAAAYGVDHLIGTGLEQVDGQFTGNGEGTPCFKEGKITKLESWMKEAGETLEGSWFYSDSSNDLPLLRKAENPVVVNGDENLRKVAEEQGWPQLDLRD